MEFDNLGAHCYTCKRQDYLPWECDTCKQKFCKLHIKNHTCLKTKSNKKKKKSKSKRLKCHLCKKKNDPVLSMNCKQCHNIFCIKHRHPEVHNCCYEEVKKKHPEEKKNCLQYLLKIIC